MDHIVDHIMDYMHSDLEEFKKEWESGEYKRLYDCPTYQLIKVYCDSMNVLIKGHYRKDKVKEYWKTPKNCLEYHIQFGDMFRLPVREKVYHIK